ncbi:MAG TPA: hypothetical protein VFM55_21220 [Micromonosporaceae bacterium]|nr:hypothetical protein [Micromonosporaceae bacterium]
MRPLLTHTAASRRHLRDSASPVPELEPAQYRLRRHPKVAPVPRRGRFGLLAIAAATLVATLAPPAVAAPRLRVIDLGALTSACCSQANAINDRGDVVGGSSLSPHSHHAVLWRNGRMTDLGTLSDGRFSTATDINNHGDIVGVSDVGAASTHAVLWRGGQAIDLGTLGGSYSHATAVNDAGEVVGYSTVSQWSNDLHAFLWRRGVMTDLGLLDNGSAGAADINNRGQVVGYSSVDEMSSVPVRWERGAVQSLTNLRGQASAINDRGDVVGYYDGSAGSFLWSGGRIINLGRPAGASVMQAVGVNNRGEVVGYTDTSAFLWRRAGMTSLPSLAGGASGAMDVNNRGQVVGFSATDRQWSNSHAVLWTY